ncbi:MAG TPA: NAD-dependent protein deacetylase [Tessaracoccus flavescens]|uniref:protein acetyllysine N-acetyltransferase n=1 Tax=Tessaracoccus flavescens TaxID=399497 RepID=A0A921ENV3_9ACTN|nr:NAD-dependent protein deacetylase [Tessaracoccus flavescens]
MTDKPVPDVGGWFRTADYSGKLSGRTITPRHGPISADGYGLVSPSWVLDEAFTLIDGRSTMVLTGAGMSTGSGLPDYRGADAVPRSPMTYQEFTGSDLSRRRYWARSTVGWRWFDAARPNTAHHALVALGERTPLSGVVTQNVDGLHQEAGSSPVLDLHGNLSRVLCLTCGDVTERSALQETLLEMNPDFAGRLEELSQESMTAPDGDAEVDRTEEFRYPDCAVCGGILKPDVVFFGENAHPEIVGRAFTLLEESSALLVLGSSLTVMSGLRFVRRAAKDGRDIVIAGDGPTRGDDLATVRVHGRLEDILSRWAG